MTRYARARRDTLPEWWTYDIKAPPATTRWSALAALALAALGLAMACSAVL